MGAASSGGSDDQVSGAEAVTIGGTTYGSRKFKDVNKQIAEQNKKNRKKRGSIFDKSIAATVASGITNSKFVRDHNYKRRVAFAKKTGKFKNTPLTREFVLSTGFKRQLDALGYAKSLRGPEGQPDKDPPRVETRNVGGTNIQVEVPTEAEVSQSESTSTEYDPRKTKRRGRRMTILTRNAGNFTLSKPTLLGV